MARTLPPAPGSTILFEGDSLTGFRVKPCLDTWPWQRLTGAHYGYPERVGDWLFCNRPDLRLNCRNGAIGGAILGDVLERFDSIAAPLKPGIMVMTIGGNDRAREIPLERFREQATTLCRRLRDHCGGRVLYLGNLLPLPDAPAAVQAKRRDTAPYYAAMAAAAEAHGGLAVDLGSVLVRRLEALKALWDGHGITHDGTHFNPVGYEIIATVVLRALGLVELPGDPGAPS